MKHATRTLAIFTALSALPAMAATKLFESFEGDGFGSWEEKGTAFGKAPIPGITKGLTAELTSYSGESLACSAHEGDTATGSLTSAEFTIEEPYIVFLLAGGNLPGKTCVQLVVDGKVEKEATGKNSLRCESATWDVSALKGKKARIRIVDEERGLWGMIAVDHIIFTDYMNQKFPPVTKGNKPYTKGLVSSPVLPGVTIPEGVTAKVMADYKTQKVTSPTALCFDEKGNMYVSETHRFRFGVEDDRDNLYWYLDDLAAQTVEDRRKLHEKWKEKKPIAKLTEKSEIVRLLIDKDGDGVCETNKVFADGFNDVLDGTAAGVFAMEGTVYLASIPNIWTLRDKNGDGISDEKKILQGGFGVRISLSGHDLNGFALGPDGMIYGTVGDRALSFKTKEGKSYHYPNEGAAFRFEPDGSNFELIHTGLRNPKEIAFDAQGNAISVDNNSDQGDKARVVYIVPGGDSGWQMEHQAMHTFYKQIGLDSHPVNRWMAERMWEPQNDEQPAFIVPTMANLTSGPSGLTYHPGAGFLESEVGRFLICDYRGASAGSGIYSFSVAPEGAGMKLVDAREFNWGVAATDVEYSYDGKLVVADYKGGWTSHEDGRIYSLDAEKNTYLPDAVTQVKQWFAEGFQKRSTAELAGMLAHPDMRVRLRAQVELSRRPDGFAVFQTGLQSRKPMERLHSMWGLGIIARRGIVPAADADGFAGVPDASKMKSAANLLIELLKDPDAEIRTQALKMLADVKGLPVAKMGLGALLKDESPRVVFYAALLVARQGDKFLVPQIVEMLKANQDKDPFLRHAGSYALSQLLKEQDFNALRAETDPSVRLAMVVALRRLKSPLLQEFVVDENPRVADEAIRAIHDQMLEECRPAVAELLDETKAVKRTEMMWRRLLHSAYRLGTAKNAERLLKAASNEELPGNVRQEAIRLLATWSKPFPVEQSIGIWAPLAERPADEIKPVLSAGLPALIRGGGAVLAKALGLVEQYQLNLAGLGAEDLQKLVDNKTLPGAARAKALELYCQKNPADVDRALSAWAQDADPVLALAALQEMVKRQPQAALVPLKKWLQSKDVAMAQGAWSLMAKIPGDSAATEIVQGLGALTQAKGVLPYAIELLETAEARSEASVKKALADWKASLPADDMLAPWKIAMEGGNAKRGEQIYLSHPAECMRCHRAGQGHEAGGEAGPNLAGVGARGDRHFMIESMMVPGAKVAAGYGVVSATLNNGKSVGGIMVQETKDFIDIDVGESISRVNRADIKEMTPPLSAMPPMMGLLKPREARDLVEWLTTLKKQTPAKKSPKKVVPMKVSQSRVKPSQEASGLMMVSTAEPAEAAPAAATISPEVMALGKTQFAGCMACHGADGGGAPGVGPPLAGSEWVTGPVENLIRIQLRGLMGPIKVKGTEYNLVMPPQAHQNDDQIAAVLTYIRNSFGNQAGPVTAAQVAALRSEVGKPMLNAGDLIAPPKPVSQPVADAGATTAAKSSAAALTLSARLGVPLWVAALFVLWIGLCLRIAFKPRN
jgi:quinoprotein glucose dehydrogenase